MSKAARKTHRSVKATIRALGGAAQVAREAGISMQAVCNWTSEGFIPPGYHHAFYLRLRSQGQDVAPSVFGLDSAGWPLKARRVS